VVLITGPGPGRRPRGSRPGAAMCTWLSSGSGWGRGRRQGGRRVLGQSQAWLRRAGRSTEVIFRSSGSAVDEIDPEVEQAAELFAVQAALALGRAYREGSLNTALQTPKADRPGNWHCHAAVPDRRGRRLPLPRSCVPVQQRKAPACRAGAGAAGQRPGPSRCDGRGPESEQEQQARRSELPASGELREV
jgi:hypothetical protein